MIDFKKLDEHIMEFARRFDLRVSSAMNAVVLLKNQRSSYPLCKGKTLYDAFIIECELTYRVRRGIFDDHFILQR